tara:strand:- start:19585 stop:21351 length:1767 start_codon:yes stop_codon:yes gene_type:complete
MNTTNNTNCVDNKSVPITINIDKVFNTDENGNRILDTTFKNNERLDHTNYSLYNRTFDPYKENISILVDGKTVQSNTDNYETPPCFDIVLNKWPRSSKEQFNELPGLKIRDDLDNNIFWGDKLKDTNKLELEESDFSQKNYFSDNCPKSNIKLTNNGKNPPTEYLKNIDIDSRLKNIDYERTGCGKKEFKNPSILSSECDSFFEHDYYDPSSVSNSPITTKDDTPFISEWTKYMANENNKYRNRSYVYNNSTNPRNLTGKYINTKSELLFNNNTRGGGCGVRNRYKVASGDQITMGEIELLNYSSEVKNFLKLLLERLNELQSKNWSLSYDGVTYQAWTPSSDWGDILVLRQRYAGTRRGSNINTKSAILPLRADNILNLTDKRIMREIIGINKKPDNLLSEIQIIRDLWEQTILYAESDQRTLSSNDCRILCDDICDPEVCKTEDRCDIIKRSINTPRCNTCPTASEPTCMVKGSPLNNAVKAMNKKRDITYKEWVDTDGTATWSVDNCKYKPDPTGPSQYGPKYQEVDSGILKDMWDENHGPCRGKPTAVVRPEYSNWETATLSAGQTYPATGKNTRILWTPPEIN